MRLPAAHAVRTAKRAVAPVIILLLVFAMRQQPALALPSQPHPALPIDRLRRVYGRRLTPAFTSRLYSVLNHSRIVGPSLDIDLAHARTSRIAPAPPASFSATLNGRPFRPRLLRTAVHSVAGYTAVTVDDRVRALWGNGLQLFPTLHDFPDLLVDHAARHRHALPAPSAIEGITASRVSLARQDAHPHPVSCANLSPHRVVRVAAAFDNYLCARFANDASMTTSIVRAVIFAAEEAYTSHTCLLLNTVHVEAHCQDPNDPYQRLSNYRDNANVVRGFRNIWVDQRSHITRDLAYFFPGFHDTTLGNSGIAWVGSACRVRTQYGFVENIDPFVTAHEIGHNLNATHTSSGLMQATVPSEMRFSEFSLSEIIAFVDKTPSATCLQEGTTPPAPPTPPPSPSRSPRPDTGFCSYLLDFNLQGSDMMICSRTSLSVAFTPTVFLGVDVDQKSQRFDVTLIPPQPSLLTTDAISVHTVYSISAFRLLVSTDAIANMDDPLWRTKWNNSNPGNATMRWPASHVRAKGDWQSCCYQDLFVHLNVDLKVVETSTANGSDTVSQSKFSKSDTLKFAIICAYCPDRIIPMTPSKRCPNCTRR